MKEWLEVLLPSDAHILCSGRLYIQCNQVFPRPGMEVISEFSCKPDLIAVLLASCHIPFFMDSKFSANVRGKKYIDGAIWGDRNTLGMQGLDAHISLDPFEDPDILADSYSSMNYKGMESILAMMEKGKKFFFEHERAHYYLNNPGKCILEQPCFIGSKPEGYESDLNDEQEAREQLNIVPLRPHSSSGGILHFC